MWPGLMLQNLTTREPDEEQLAVAIASLERGARPEEDSRAMASEASSHDRDRRLAPSARASKVCVTMIEPLVEQIEARFAELEAQMSDPEVIGDRERYAEVGREYRELQPAQELAARVRGR